MRALVFLSVFVACADDTPTMASKRVRTQNFSTREEIALVESVIAQYDAIFPSFRGTVRATSDREEAWERVAAAVNAIGGNMRTTVSVEKKFHNIKQSAKNKGDQIRCPPTGGGPEVVLTTSEKMWLDAMSARGNPSIRGIQGGIDCLDEAFSTIDTAELDFLVNGDASQSPITPYENTSAPNIMPMTTTLVPPVSSREKRMSRKRKVDERSQIEKEILLLEKNKIQLEIDLLNKKNADAELKHNVLLLQQQFYSAFLQKMNES